MKIHPKLECLLGYLQTSKSPAAQEAWNLWVEAGKPVTEDEPKSARQWVMENIEPLNRAIYEMQKKDDRIRELEKKLADYKIHLAEKEHDLMRKFEDWGLFSGLTGRFSNPTDIRNAALEEAANIAESGPPWLICHRDDRATVAARIRSLKMVTK